MYRVAAFLLNEWWGRHADMVDALTVLLLTWNAAFYRFRTFDQSRLESCLQKHWSTIQSFRQREINSFVKSDHRPLELLFLALLEALQISSGKRRGRQSPVATSKTLHLLAPMFLPIWDNAIAHHYECQYSSDPSGAYIKFCGKIKKIAAALKPVVPPSSKTLLKQIDEFNYAKYTKNWI